MTQSADITTAPPHDDDGLRRRAALARDVAPIFVVGYPRSGTTLFRRMLNLNRAIVVPPESDMFQRVPPRFPHGLRQAADVDALLAALPPYFAEFFDLERFAALARADLPVSTPAIFALLHATARGGADKTGARWGHKEPHEWPFVYRWRSWYPTAQFLHIVRRPHDVVASIAHYMARDVRLHSITPTPLISAWHWRAAHRSLRDQARQMPPQRMMMLRYEDLIADAETRLREVCQFLGAPERDAPQMMAFHAEKVAERMTDRGEHMDQTRRPLNTDSVDRGAKNLPEQVLRDIDHLCRREMAALGYAPAAEGRASAARRLALDALGLGLDAAWFALRAWRRARGRL